LFGMEVMKKNYPLLILLVSVVVVILNVVLTEKDLWFWLRAISGLMVAIAMLMVIRQNKKNNNNR